MLWRTREPARIRLIEADGLSAGMVVQHKVTGAKAVIVEVYEEGGLLWARVSVGWSAQEEFDTTIAEIEAFRAPASTNAIDPSAPDPGTPTTRD